MLSDPLVGWFLSLIGHYKSTNFTHPAKVEREIEQGHGMVLYEPSKGYQVP